MRKNDIVKIETGVFRILDTNGENILSIDCDKKTMPQFFPVSFFQNGEILNEIPCSFPSWEELSPNEKNSAKALYDDCSCCGCRE